MIYIERYIPDLREQWDETVKNTRNGTFLHLRDYMDYHSDRFRDCSLIARDSKRRIISVLPANISGETLYSHSGLTYGGWLMTQSVTAESMLAIWEAMFSYIRTNGITSLIYKPVPHIYHKYPAEEDLYALWRSGACQTASQVSAVVNLDSSPGLDTTARRKVKKAKELGMVFSEDDDWDSFWNILTLCLKTRHSVSPVHTSTEIKLLKSRFPDEIRLFTVRFEGRIVAGAVMYLTDTVAHNQYTATTDEGRELNALPYLFERIMSLYRPVKRFFDFGISTEDGGRILNEGLSRLKNNLGGRAVQYTTYKLDF